MYELMDYIKLKRLSNVNKPPYATVFLVLVFIVRLHCMFRPLIGGHHQAICDKIYSKVATVYVQRIRWVDLYEASAVVM
jgi:hypothetical protein